MNRSRKDEFGLLEDGREVNVLGPVGLDAGDVSEADHAHNAGGRQALKLKNEVEREREKDSRSARFGRVLRIAGGETYRQERSRF